MATPKKTKVEPTYRTEKIGEVEIDTGTLVISDPCNIGGLELDFENLGTTQQLLGEPYKNGKERKVAILSTTGLGDGRYPVFAEIVDGEMGERVIALHIHLDFMYCFADDKRAKKDIAKQEAEYLAMMNATEAKEHTEHDTVNT